MKTDDDWGCMSCALHLPTDPIMKATAWQVVEPYYSSSAARGTTGLHPKSARGSTVPPGSSGSGENGVGAARGMEEDPMEEEETIPYEGSDERYQDNPPRVPRAHAPRAPKVHKVDSKSGRHSADPDRVGEADMDEYGTEGGARGGTSSGRLSERAGTSRRDSVRRNPKFNNPDMVSSGCISFRGSKHILPASTSGSGASSKQTVHFQPPQQTQQHQQQHNTGNRGTKEVQDAHGNPASSAGASSTAGLKQNPYTLVDEVYYFNQYINYCNEQDAALASSPREGEKKEIRKVKKHLWDIPRSKNKNKSKMNTDDACFLCKDGGELIECDYCYTRGNNPTRCLKVYHDYCLDYKVPETQKFWKCPRHTCTHCGSEDIKFVCKYCPISICGGCTKEMTERYNHARYSLFDPVSLISSGLGPDVQSIACQSCVEMIERCKVSQM